MTAPPQVIERALTFHFAKSVSVTTGLPDIMEVALIPLDNAADNTAGATFAGGLKSVTVELANPVNPVTFNLIPTYSPGLSNPINYRVMWRAGVLGRTYSYDFAMPDADLTWDQLTSTVGNIIDGTSYLQQSDLGVPGRVARLNDQGVPITAAGIPMASSDDITVLTNSLTSEINNRATAISGLRTQLEDELSTQDAANLTTAEHYTDNAITGVNNALSTETASRISADAGLQSQINANNTHLQDEIDSLTASTGGNTTALDHKADLDSGGHILVSQIPDTILTGAVAVPDQAAMLALSPTVVHKGDLAVRPDGVWLLSTDDPSVLSNWVSLTTVSSVNGHRGAVTLGPSDVGAIPVGGAIAMSQVTGLSTALGGKTDTSVTTTLAQRVTTLEQDPNIVRTSGGVIQDSVLPADIALVNPSGQVTKKDGTVVASGGSGGFADPTTTLGDLIVHGLSGTTRLGAGAAGTWLKTGGTNGVQYAAITEADVASLTTDLAARVLSSDSRLTNARTPTAHAASHGSTGSDPITIAQSQVTGLPGIIANNALTSSSNAVNRIAALETAVAGGSGGGGGTPAQAVFYTSANTTTSVTDFTQVNVHSPWGIDSDGTITGTTGTWYYLYTGVRPADVAYPYITGNGHLLLRQWNEAGAPDPVYALASDLTTTNTLVATKADQSALTTLSATVDTKAAQADLTATNNTVATKADQSALNTTNATVATKANQSDLTATNNTVATKADQSALNTTNTNVAAIQAALPTKADLSSGKVPLAQLPNIPESQVTNLGTDLAAKADLSGGKVLLTQIPTNIPQSSISGLSGALGGKADLVGGLVPLSQLPQSALPNIQVVANRAAMLALTTSQVQFGDLALITGTTDKGTYVLTGSDPSVFSNWTELVTPDAPVTSVNTQTGTVVLGPTDVGALAANASIPISQISGLQAQLNSFATSAALTTGLAGKTSPTDVQNTLTNSVVVKRADYVATSAIASMAGQQSADGVLMPTGAIVLLTAQSSSVNNGLWTVNSGAWTRPADFATASYLIKDTITIVSNTTASANGAGNNYTIWQESAASGFIDTAANNWSRIAFVAPPFVPVAGNGITIAGSTFTANVAPGQGVLVTGSGLSSDPNVVPRKFLGTVPSGSTTATITHNLNSTSPMVSIWDTASNTLVTAGITVTSANALSIEFANAPTSGQFRCCVLA